jgi:hypothetical protein
LRSLVPPPCVLPVRLCQPTKSHGEREQPRGRLAVRLPSFGGARCRTCIAGAKNGRRGGGTTEVRKVIAHVSICPLSGADLQMLPGPAGHVWTRNINMSVETHRLDSPCEGGVDLREDGGGGQPPQSIFRSRSTAWDLLETILAHARNMCKTKRRRESRHRGLILSGCRPSPSLGIGGPERDGKWGQAWRV